MEFYIDRTHGIQIWIEVDANGIITNFPEKYDPKITPKLNKDYRGWNIGEFKRELEERLSGYWVHSNELQGCRRVIDSHERMVKYWYAQEGDNTDIINHYKNLLSEARGFKKAHEQRLKKMGFLN